MILIASVEDSINSAMVPQNRTVGMTPKLPKSKLIKTESFADFEKNAHNIPTHPGVYAIWKDDELLYVGMAGKNWTKKRQKANHGHLQNRLKKHAAARRSNNLVYYLIQDYVGRSITEKQWRDISDPQKKVTLQDKVKEYMNYNLSYSYAPVPREETDSKRKRAIAREWEKQLIEGKLGIKPKYNN